MPVGPKGERIPFTPHERDAKILRDVVEHLDDDLARELRRRAVGLSGDATPIVLDIYGAVEIFGLFRIKQMYERAGWGTVSFPLPTEVENDLCLQRVCFHLRRGAVKDPLPHIRQWHEAIAVLHGGA